MTGMRSVGDQDPPETTAAGAACADEGACAGWESPPPLELELEPVFPELEACEDWLVVAADAVCPWKERAATSEIIPASATAPAIIQRLIRRISSSPASRAEADLLFIADPMFGSACKKALKAQ
jgi:hypothetical protein